MRQYFLGFELKDGRTTTCGEPNAKTGLHSIAGNLEMFPACGKHTYLNAAKSWARDEWVDQSDKRISVTRQEARRLFRGLSMTDYKAMIDGMFDEMTGFGFSGDEG